MSNELTMDLLLVHRVKCLCGAIHAREGTENLVGTIRCFCGRQIEFRDKAPYVTGDFRPTNRHFIATRSGSRIEIDELRTEWDMRKEMPGARQKRII